MIESRLLQILFILLEQGSVTAPELARKFEVSARTIYRDVDALSAAGIPVYAVRGKGGGIFLRENYVLDKNLFSDEEQKELLAALQNFNLTDGALTSPLTAKVKALFKKDSVDWLEIDFSDWTGLRDQLFDQLRQAILSQTVIRISYLSTKGQATERELEPLKLVFRDKAWYLYAFCQLRQAHRLFKISRIQELQFLKKTFNRNIPEKVFKEKKTAASTNVVELTLRFAPEAAYRVYEEFKEIIQNSDGSMRVKIKFTDDDSTLNYLFSFGEYLEVLEPREYREKIAARIENLLNKYRT